MRHIRLHDLRHTYATLRIAAGHDITDVSKQLGHSSIKITVDIYYKYKSGTRKSEVDQLDSDTPPNYGNLRQTTKLNWREAYNNMKSQPLTPLALRRLAPPKKKGLAGLANPLISLVELRGIEPLTS